MQNAEKTKLYKSLIFPGILLLMIWLVKLIEVYFHTDLSEFGIFPQHISGLRGIVFSPLLHASWAHLWANSLPLFVLSAGLFYYYDKLAYRLLLLLWLTTGFWVWVFAKDSGIHIGASGIVYALAAFHFTSGVIRKEPRMMAFSLLVVFLYGGLIWGVIPNFLPEKNISWESHLLGLLAGLIVALFYKSYGPQRKVHVWEDEEDSDEEAFEQDEEPDANGIARDVVKEQEKTKEDEMNTPTVVYHLKKNPPTRESGNQ